MAGKRKQESDSLNAVLKVAEEVVDSASKILSETVEAVTKLNEPLLGVEADIIEHISPTAAELLRPESGKKKNEPSSEDKTGKAKTREAGKKDQSNRRKTKLSKDSKNTRASRKKGETKTDN